MSAHTRRMPRTPPRSADEVLAELVHKRDNASTLVARQLVVTEALAAARGEDADAAFEVTADLQALMDEATWLEHTLAKLNDELVKLERSHRAAVVLLTPALPITAEPIPSESIAVESPYATEQKSDDVAPTDETPRLGGRVHSYDRIKGYGFLIPDDQGRRVFCHKSAIQSGSELYTGQRVSFVVSPDDARGPRAKCVIAIEGA